ncbi:MAG TPA: hypothetical protein VFR58_10180 [Flavisolibacter sp.]|nr:hypothetical protein [Flavisolibacter sp.]
MRIFLLVLLGLPVFCFSQVAKLPVIKPFYMVSLSNSFELFGGGTEVFTQYDAILFSVRSSLPMGRDGEVLPKKKMHYYSEAFFRNAATPPAEVRMNGYELTLQETSDAGGQRFTRFATARKGTLNTTADLYYPSWSVKSGKDVAGFDSTVTPDRFIYPWHFGVPQQQIPATSVSMPQGMEDFYEYNVKGEHLLKAERSNGPYALEPFKAPDGGHFLVGGIKQSGFTVTKAYREGDNAFQYPLMSGSMLLGGKRSQTENCYIIFRSYKMYPVWVEHSYLGQRKPKQRWLFVSVTEDVVLANLVFSP